MGFRKIDSFLNLYITGDLHLSYNLNRSIQNRGFINPIEHTRHIRDTINKTCKSHSDVLIINGDFSSDMDLTRVFLKEITPKNIWAVLGNHDRRKEMQSLFNGGYISRSEHELKINWRGNQYDIQHLPLREWSSFYRNGYHWHAHTHNTLQPYLRAHDCGWDVFGEPVPLDKIVDLRQQYSNIDENGKRIEFSIDKQL